MKCDFCNHEFPAEELETKTGALHDSGDVEKYHVCETCAASIRIRLAVCCPILAIHV